MAWLSIYAHAQPGTTIQACTNTSCYYQCPGIGTLVWDNAYETGSGSSLRYGYVDGGGIVVTFNTALNRWEVAYSDGTEYVALFYNTTASIPKPPDLTLGSWVRDPAGYCSASSVFQTFEGTGTQSTTTLPIELVSFDAQTIQGGKSLLTWTTASETNNAGFDIEASQDGIRFNKIGFVKGHGTTNEVTRYSFTDERAASGLTYYRLKQLDVDDGFDYSKVISVLRKGDNLNAVSISPIPANDLLNIVLETQNEDDLAINLFDAFGKTILQQNTTTQKGSNNKSLDLQDLPQGIYFLELQQGTERVIRKVVKE
ncbi:MAG: T9SS type A sorting domain-containing protein [Saprospiraceae bacterium]|nr:T9SS type A sorting domain-containing protein [Saprospiraceae bacterium]